MAEDLPDPNREEPEPLEGAPSPGEVGADELAQQAPPSPEQVAEEAIEAFDGIEAELTEVLSQPEPDEPWTGEGEDFADELLAMDPITEGAGFGDEEDLLAGLEDSLPENPPAPEKTLAAEEPLASEETEDLFDFEGYLAARPSQDPGAIELRELGEVLDSVLETAENPNCAAPPEPEPELVPRPAAVKGGYEPQFQPGDDEGSEPVYRTVVTTHPRFGLLALLLVGGLTLVNAAVVTFSWWANTDLEASMRDIGDQVVQTAREVRFETALHAEEIESLLGPVASVDVEHRRTFDSVAQDLEQGRFGQARRKLYSLLAIADRLDERVRQDAEARARFLLADSLRLEAQALDPEAWEQNP